MDRQLIEQMFELEDHHWWFCGRRDIILHLVQKFTLAYLQPGALPKICDLGVGAGRLLSELAPLADVYGLDQSVEALQAARQRGLENLARGWLPDLVPFADKTFDLVLLLDVLEHVEDDREALHGALKLVKDGGTLICTVPAYQFLWTNHDAAHGHKRRYTRDALRNLFAGASVDIEILSYFNFLLFPLAIVQRLAQKWFSGSKTDNTEMVTTPPEPINLLLRKIFSAEKFILPNLSFPCGLSVLCLARKKPADNSGSGS